MAATENPNRPRRAAWVAALFITALTVVLHFRLLNHAGGLWRDEANLVNLAAKPTLAEMSRDSFPVLMPMLVHGWLKFNFANEDFGLRCFGILVGFGILAAFWVHAWTTRCAPPFISLALCALNSLVITYGDSLRPYGLGSALIVFAAAGAWAFLSNPTWTRVTIFAALAALSAQTLYQNAPLVGAICAGTFVVCWRRKEYSAALKIFLAGLVAALFLTPYLPNLLFALNSSANLRTGFQPDVIRDNLELALNFPLQFFIFIWALLPLAVIVCGFRKRSDAHLFASATLLFALMGYAGFFWFAALPTAPWYFLPLMALVAACFDAGMPELPKNFRAAGFGLVTASALAAALFAWRDVDFCFTNADTLARLVASHADKNDLVIVQPWYCGISFDRYFHAETAWTTLPPLADHSVHRYDLVQAQMKQTNALAPVFENISATLRAGHRVWIVGWMDVPAENSAPPKDLPPPPLKFSGWSDTPYDINWGLQTAHFLRQHSQMFQRAKVANENINPHENLGLLVADGWRER